MEFRNPFPSLLGMNNQEPDPYQSLLGGYYTPQQARRAWLGGTLQGLGAGLASGKSGAWAQGLALGGGEGLDNYRQRAVAASALDMRKQEYDYQQQQRQEEAAARQAEEEAQAAAIAGMPPEMRGFAKAFPSAVVPSYVKNKYFPDPVAYNEAPPTKTIFDPQTGQEQVVQWTGSGWAPLGGKKSSQDNRATATDKKELWKSEDELPAIDGTIASLDRALELNEKTFTGVTAGVRGWAGTAIPGAGMVLDPNAAAATREFNQIMSMEAIKSMADTLAGATTDQELRQFVEILADPSTPPDIRKRTILRMKTLAERQKAIKTQRVKELKGSNGNGGAPQPVVTEDGYTIEAVPEN
jgi:hypothetical protein